MNGLQRIAATLAWQATDRPPVIPQIFGHTARLIGRPLIDYIQSGEIAAACQLAALSEYGADAVFALLDVCIEAEAIGAAVAFHDEFYPAVTEPPLKPDTDLAALAVPDPRQAARMPQVLDLAARLRATVRDETLVVGCVQGPMTLAVQFMGMENTLFCAVDRPDCFERVLDYATNVALRYGIAQIEAGVHLPMIFEPAGSPEVVPAAFFREFIAPRLRRLFTAYKAAGAVTSWLHIAGRSQTILPLYRELGANIGNFDYPVSPAEVLAQLPAGGLVVDGNIKPYAFVEDSPEAITAACDALLDAFAPRGGFILSSGCEIPPEARPENIRAMVAAARRRARHA
jgi:uroporphyrinogen decarboxylase